MPCEQDKSGSVAKVKQHDCTTAVRQRNQLGPKTSFSSRKRIKARFEENSSIPLTKLLQKIADSSR